MTTYIIGSKNGGTVTFTLKKFGAKWYLDVITKRGSVLVGSYKTKKEGEQMIDDFATGRKPFSYLE